MSDRTDEPHLASEVIRLRKAGVFFSEIGRQLGCTTAMARYYCKRALARGEVTHDELSMAPQKPSPMRSSDSAYNLQWVLRILSKCKVDEKGCWIWQGGTTLNGYGQTNYRTPDNWRRNRASIVHRDMYRIVSGKELTKWEYVCHHCDVKLCCNPAHLWLGSPTDNSRDEVSKGRHPEQKVTQCPKGHPYDEVNTYVSPSGSRSCKECNRARCREAWRNGKAKLRQQRLRARKRLAQEQRA